MKSTNKIYKKEYLLTLPGWSTDASIWDDISDELSKYFELIHLQWSEVETINSFKKKIEDEIIKKEIKKVSILGWSLGTLAGIEFAYSYPQLVDRLILISATPRFTIDRESEYNFGWNPRVIKRMQQNLLKTPEETLKSFYNSMYSNSERECSYRMKDFNLLKKGHINTKELEWLNIGLHYLMDRDLRHDVKKIKIPILLIHGKEDIVCPPNASEYILDSNKEYCTLKLINNCGHIPFITRTEECLEYIKEFLEKSEKKYDR